jgi:hypothetical protein
VTAARCPSYHNDSQVRCFRLRVKNFTAGSLLLLFVVEDTSLDLGIVRHGHHAAVRQKSLIDFFTISIISSSPVDQYRLVHQQVVASIISSSPIGQFTPLACHFNTQYLPHQLVNVVLEHIVFFSDVYVLILHHLCPPRHIC